MIRANSKFEFFGKTPGSTSCFLKNTFPMRSDEAKPRSRKLLIYGLLFLLLGVAAVIVTPGNYFLYANFLIGIIYIGFYAFGR